MPHTRKIAILFGTLVISIIVFIFFKKVISTNSKQFCISIIYEIPFGCLVLPEKYKVLTDYQYESITVKTLNNSKAIDQKIVSYLNNSASRKALKVNLTDSRYEHFINTLDIFLKHNIHSLYFKDDNLYYFKDTVPIDYEGIIHINDSLYEY
jgi:c-di-AMP phosphodiesterase-like protein